MYLRSKIQINNAVGNKLLDTYYKNKLIYTFTNGHATFYDAHKILSICEIHFHVGVV